MSRGIQVNVGHRNPRGQVVLDVSIACGVLVTAAVALRFLARRRLGTKIKIDDWLILIALIPNYGMIIDSGFGTPNFDVAMSS